MRSFAIDVLGLRVAGEDSADVVELAWRRPTERFWSSASGRASLLRPSGRCGVPVDGIDAAPASSRAQPHALELRADAPPIERYAWHPGDLVRCRGNEHFRTASRPGRRLARPPGDPAAADWIRRVPSPHGLRDAMPGTTPWRALRPVAHRGDDARPRCDRAMGTLAADISPSSACLEAALPIVDRPSVVARRRRCATGWGWASRRDASTRRVSSGPRTAVVNAVRPRRKWPVWTQHNLQFASNSRRLARSSPAPLERLRRNPATTVRTTATARPRLQRSPRTASRAVAHWRTRRKSSLSSPATRSPSTSIANDRIRETLSVPTPIHRMPLTATEQPYAVHATPRGCAWLAREQRRSAPNAMP